MIQNGQFFVFKLLVHGNIKHTDVNLSIIRQFNNSDNNNSIIFIQVELVQQMLLSIKDL